MVDLHPRPSPDRDSAFQLALGVVRQEPERKIDQPLEPLVRDPGQRVLGRGLGPLAAVDMVQPCQLDRAEAALEPPRDRLGDPLRRDAPGLHRTWGIHQRAMRGQHQRPILPAGAALLAFLDHVLGADLGERLLIDRAERTNRRTAPVRAHQLRGPPRDLVRECRLNGVHGHDRDRLVSGELLQHIRQQGIAELVRGPNPPVFARRQPL